MFISLNLAWKLRQSNPIYLNNFSKWACVSGYFIKICNNVEHIQELDKKYERCTDNVPYY